jgi:two-component system LytT family response regulator
MLAAFEWLVIAGEAANGPATVEAIDRLRPELVFLDIQMPGLLGTDVLSRVSHQPYVVFTTAHSQYAAAAFELGALDYVLKPFGPERLAKALDRARAAMGEPSAAPALDRLREALSSGPMTRLFVRLGPNVIPVAVSSVSWFGASGDYVAAHVGQSRYMMHLPLTRLEARLDRTKFFRIHRTHIVNIDYVAAFRKHGKGQLLAELTDGTSLVVSRDRAKEIRSVGL